MPTTNPIEGDAFHDFERSGWRSNVSAYEASFARLTRQAIDPLLNALSPSRVPYLMTARSQSSAANKSEEI